MAGDKASSSGGSPRAGAFVGRERELAELCSGLDESLAGQARLFLLLGEPGIGKTRLAEELALEARRRGALVLWGQCWEDRGAPAYWPWTQILRGILREPAARQSLAALGGDADRLAQIVPDLRGEPGDGRGDVVIDRDEARFALFDAVASLLVRTAAKHPLVLVLDDLHAADPPSLLLLRFVARELRDAAVLLVATYRSAEVERSPERAELLGHVGRFGKRLPLSGLDQTQVAALIEQVCEVRPSVALASAVHRTTEGNPFFVDEVARLLAAEGVAKLPDERAVALLRIPHGVREAVRERLRPLSEGCRAVLSVAAVIGREFDLRLLQAAAAQPVEVLLNLLGEATTLGVVTAIPGTLARYGFAHALFRDSLYDDQLPAERLRLHRAIGEALERVHGADLGPRVAELAYHFLAAAPGGDVDKAATYAARAGAQALAQLAYEDAASHYEHALQALTLAAQHDACRQCELLLALGQAQRAASHASARDTFRRAVDMAREVVGAGNPAGPELLARTVLGLANRGLGVPNMSADAEVVGLLEEAMQLLGEGDHPLRAQAMGRLAMELSSGDGSSRSQTLSRAAVEMARRLADTTTLAATLSARQFILWRVDHIIDRLSISAEIIQLAEAAGNKELALQGRTWRLVDLMGIGNVHAFDAEIDKQAQQAEELRQPRYLWMTASLRAMRALWNAQWDVAQSCAQQALVLGERVGDQYAAVSPWVQFFIIRRERGQLAPEEAMAKFFAERYPSSPVPRTFLAVIHMELGRAAEAREQLEKVASEDFANLERERRVGVLPCLAEVCAFVGDAARAAILARQLQPYAHGNLPYGAVVTFGATSHYLGLLAATMGDWDGAVRYFEEALELNARMEARAWLVRTQYELARLLLARRAAGDCARALQLAEQCLDGAVSHGMVSVAAKAEILLERVRQAQHEAPAPRDDEATRLRAYGGGAYVAPIEDSASSPQPAPPSDADLPQRRGRVLSFSRQQRRDRQTAAAAASATTPQKAAPAELGSSPGGAIFRRDGEYWSVGDSRAMVRLKDSKGLRYIARLLRHPGHDFHAADLVAAEESTQTEPASAFAALSSEQLADLGMHTEGSESGTGPLLDAQAKGAYRRRIEDLRDEFDEAQRFNDVERAARVGQELQFLTAELARAVGLGGRDRPGGTQGEKARLNVTRAIKAVVKRIEEHNPSLGRYLATTVKTGAFCSYTPDPRFPVDWKL